MLQELIEKFGSYLGECFIWCYGGYWEKGSGHWRVSFDDGNAVHPFSKIQKQVENGSEDSIKSFSRQFLLSLSLQMERENN
jgi:hypothetical protein